MGDLEWPAPPTKAVTTNDTSSPGLRNTEAASTRGCLCPPSPSSFPQKVKKPHNNIKEASIIRKFYFPSCGRKNKKLFEFCFSCTRFMNEVSWWQLWHLICKPLLPWVGARELKGLESAECFVPRVAEQGHTCSWHLWLGQPVPPCSVQLPNTPLPANLLSFSNWFHVLFTGNCF